jgi:hypothetical protein
MAHWGDELNEEEIERLSEEGIKWSGIFLAIIYFNKLNQEVMWRTESKLALVAIAPIVLGGIYMSNKSNNRKADAIAVLMENGEVDSYNNVLFYTANDEQMDQRTLSALSHLSRGYDMVQVYNKMSDYNDKELWSANKPSWDTVYQTPKEKYISMLITENAAEVSRKIRKDGWASAQSPFKRAASCRLIMCSCNCALNL